MQSLRPNIDRRAWSDLAMLGLLSLLYIPLMLHWTHGWISKSISIEHEYFSHGLIGLPYAAYVIWESRQQWQNLPGGTGEFSGADRWGGLGILLLSAVMYLSGLPETVNLSFPLMLTGTCLWLKGLPGLRLFAWPLIFIWLATPNEIPYLLAPFTLPLQSFIAGTAGIMLNLLGFDVAVEGINIFMNGRHVEVAPYCAGLKMLFTSWYVALLLLHWSNTWKMRPIVIGLLSLTTLISVTGNIIRNTILTYFHGTGNDNGFTWLHDGWGGDVYSALSLALLVWVLNYLEDWFLPRNDNEATLPEA
ncbi:cyanoexosortase B [filamentous cyanobacterium LEGE 11480]|uniref:Cyanoexosortase B n=2 Tax=Romeriopsis TaxID=2992131 RepID=A0A928Z3B1_9CYAN|nr:cyanoexosortase B [Romeriopsis navalis LEGE 11480]